MEGKEQLSEIETQRQTSETSSVAAVLEAEAPEKTTDTSILTGAPEKDLFHVLTEKAHDVKEVITLKVHEVEAFLVPPEPKESVSYIKPVIEPKAVAEHEPAVEIEHKPEQEPVVGTGSDLMKVLASKSEVQKTLEWEEPDPAKKSVVDTNFSDDDFKKVECELLTITDDIRSTEVDAIEEPQEVTEVIEGTENKSGSHLIDSFNDKVNMIKNMNNKASDKLEELKETLFQKGYLIFLFIFSKQVVYVFYINIFS